MEKIFAGKNPRLIFFEGEPHLHDIGAFVPKMCCSTVLQSIHRVSVRGLEKLPFCGPYIVASNHISTHDPILLAAFLNENIKFMAKEELFRVPVVRSIVKRLDAFPVHRNGIGIGAIRHAIRLLNMGQTVGIFPEGTRNRDESNSL